MGHSADSISLIRASTAAKFFSAAFTWPICTAITGDKGMERLYQTKSRHEVAIHNTHIHTHKHIYPLILTHTHTHTHTKLNKHGTMVSNK